MGSHRRIVTRVSAGSLPTVENGLTGQEGENLRGLDWGGDCGHAEKCADVNIFREWKE